MRACVRFRVCACVCVFMCMCVLSCVCSCVCVFLRDSVYVGVLFVFKCVFVSL